MSIGNISNDIIDSKIDNINHPSRVLPKKLISKKRAYIYLFINLFLLLLNSIFIPDLAIIFLFSANLLLLLYNKLLLINNRICYHNNNDYYYDVLLF